jgi:hypothetical protein
MAAAEIRQFCVAQPFRAFVIRLSDGQALPVNHPDHVFFPPRGSLVVVVDERGGLHVIEPGQVTSLAMSQVAS